MSVILTPSETNELKLRFNNVIINESVDNKSIVHTLSSGRIVYGHVNENQEVVVNSVTEYLCG